MNQDDAQLGVGSERETAPLAEGTTDEPSSSSLPRQGDSPAAIQGGELGRVRELLFGAEVRRLDGRGDHIEQAFSEQLRALREALEQQSRALQESFQQRLDLLEAALASERSERQQAIATLEQRLERLHAELIQSSVSRSDLSRLLASVAGELAPTSVPEATIELPPESAQLDARIELATTNQFDPRTS